MPGANKVTSPGPRAPLQSAIRRTRAPQRMKIESGDGDPAREHHGGVDGFLRWAAGHDGNRRMRADNLGCQRSRLHRALGADIGRDEQRRHGREHVEHRDDVLVLHHRDDNRKTRHACRLRILRERLGARWIVRRIEQHVAPGGRPQPDRDAPANPLRRAR